MLKNLLLQLFMNHRAQLTSVRKEFGINLLEGVLLNNAAGTFLKERRRKSVQKLPSRIMRALHGKAISFCRGKLVVRVISDFLLTAAALSTQ